MNMLCYYKSIFFKVSFDVMKKKVSIIVLIYNQADKIQECYSSICSTFNTLLFEYDYEIIFVNDGSIDNSWNIITTIALLNNKVKAINLSRKFGYDNALLAGFETASGIFYVIPNKKLVWHPVLIFKALQNWNGISHYSKEIILTHKNNIQTSDINEFIHIISITMHSHPFLRILKQLTLTKIIQQKISFFSSLFIEKICSKNFTTKILLFVLVAELLPSLYLAIIINRSFSAFTFFVGTQLYLLLGLEFFMLWLIREYQVRLSQQQKNVPLYCVADVINFSEERNQKVDMRKNLEKGYI